MENEIIIFEEQNVKLEVNLKDEKVQTVSAQISRSYNMLILDKIKDKI